MYIFDLFDYHFIMPAHLGHEKMPDLSITSKNELLVGAGISIHNGIFQSLMYCILRPKKQTITLELGKYSSIIDCVL